MTRQTRAKLRRGFVKAPLSYNILAVKQIKTADKKIIAKTLVKVTNEETAKKLVGVGSKWGYKPLAYQTMRVGVITYKGIEVAILYKRVMLTLVPLPEDPVPEGTLENPDDVWVRYDLFGMSARQQVKVIRSEVESQEQEAALLRVELDAKDKIISGLQMQVKGQQTVLKSQLKEVLKDPELNRYVRVTIASHHEELQKAALKARRKGTHNED